MMTNFYLMKRMNREAARCHRELQDSRQRAHRNRRRLARRTTRSGKNRPRPGLSVAQRMKLRRQRWKRTEKTGNYSYFISLLLATPVVLAWGYLCSQWSYALFLGPVLLAAIFPAVALYDHFRASRRQRPAMDSVPSR